MSSTNNRHMVEIQDIPQAMLALASRPIRSEIPVDIIPATVMNPNKAKKRGRRCGSIALVYGELHLMGQQ